MSGNQKGRAPAELWSLVQAIVWIERHAGVPEHPIHRRIALARVQELYKALKAGMITASGCVDGGERRDISPGEWNDYRLKLKHTVFADHYFVGTAETPIIAVLSIRSFPTAALKYHGYPSGVRNSVRQRAGWRTRLPPRHYRRAIAAGTGSPAMAFRR